ncbi:hypothetical protein EOL96_08625 [Candidatus Saccharibacteria bacterium]|nr:hypothetical protein [Candidatus Saccharibacteria bacterium]
MSYVFSWSWFGIGILIVLLGAALTVWYRPIANAFGDGVSGYERYRLWGLIACGVGIIVTLNLHSLLLNWFFGMLFGSIIK